jgi:DNA-binding NarL/FixJ family response regulator
MELINIKKRVVVFDDNAHLRDSLYFLINSSDDFVCINTFPNTRKLLANIEQSKPDIVIMDIEIPGVNGIEATWLIKHHYSNIQILILTVFDDNDKIFQSLCAGGSGYMLKTSSPTQIIQGLKDVCNGGTSLSPSVANNNSITIHDYNITVKEKEILQHMIDGKSYKMISDVMSLSVETVKTHIKSIYKKLHVNSSSEAVVKAIRQNIV